jgi:hypothetical protein
LVVYYRRFQERESEQYHLATYRELPVTIRIGRLCSLAAAAHRPATVSASAADNSPPASATASIICRARSALCRVSILLTVLHQCERPDSVKVEYSGLDESGATIQEPGLGANPPSGNRSFDCPLTQSFTLTLAHSLSQRAFSSVSSWSVLSLLRAQSRPRPPSKTQSRQRV